jgi:hypothetical protein
MNHQLEMIDSIQEEQVANRRKFAVTPSNPIVKKRPILENPWMSKEEPTDTPKKEIQLVLLNEPIKPVNLNPFQNEIKEKAFAGDNVGLEFQTAKNLNMNEEINLPELDSTLYNKQGWGTWGGKGTNSVAKAKQMQHKIEKVKKEMIQSKAKTREDNHLGNVIIRETAGIPKQYLRSTVGLKDYEVKIYDNQMAHPIGVEWNTLRGHQELVEQRVQVEKGRIIKPLDYKDAIGLLEFRNQRKKREAHESGILMDEKKVDPLQEFKKVKRERERERFVLDSQQKKNMDKREKQMNRELDVVLQ